MLPLEDIVYAVNTFPKAFIVGLVLEPTPMTVVEMHSKINNNFPYLAGFSFLSKVCLRQYCKRSLANILDTTTVHSGWDKGGRVLPYSPAYYLKDSSIQEHAKFILAQSVRLGLQPEDFLALSRNSKKKSNIGSINILLHLYERGKANVNELSQFTGIDYEQTFFHLKKLEKAGLAKCTRFRSEKHDYIFKWVKGKQLKDVDFKVMERKYYVYSAMRVAFALSRVRKACTYSELKKLTGYVRGMSQYGVNALERQGFVERISSRKFAYGALTKKGVEVVEQIIKPLASMEIKKLRQEPTEEQLLKAMSMYEKRLG